MYALLVFIAAIFVYFYLKNKFEYWKRRNVPGPEPTFIVGNILPTFLKKKSLGSIVTEVYRKYQQYPVVGFYKAGAPCLIARDPDLIRDVTVKHFRSFEDNDLGVPISSNPLFGKNPFALKGHAWKKSRSRLTPSFTSGKMKTYFPIVNNISKKLVEYINKKIENGEATLDCKLVMGYFTLENVADCACGVDAKAFEDQYSDFKFMSENYITSGLGEFKTSFTFIFPKLFDFFHVRLFGKIVDDKTTEVVAKALDYRTKNNIERPDFLQQLNQIRSKDSSFSFSDIVAGVSAFIMDGHDTSSNVLSYALYELSLNPEVQGRLRDEVGEYFEKCADNPTFEDIHQLKYLDAIVSETLRLHPIFLSLGKICNERFVYETTNTKDFKKMSVTIEPGVVILLPYEGLHTDPKFFPSPLEFNPERFISGEIPKYVYMPFGEGPRTCLGQKFGVLQMKVGLAHLIKNFRFTLSEDTEVPIKTAPWHFVVAPDGGIRVKFEKI